MTKRLGHTVLIITILLLIGGVAWVIFEKSVSEMKFSKIETPGEKEYKELLSSNELNVSFRYLSQEEVSSLCADCNVTPLGIFCDECVFDNPVNAVRKPEWINKDTVRVKAYTGSLGLSPVSIEIGEKKIILKYTSHTPIVGESTKYVELVYEINKLNKKNYEFELRDANKH